MVRSLKLIDGTSIPATTLIWTAGVKPSAAIESLDCKKEQGRLLVNEYLARSGSHAGYGPLAIARQFQAVETGNFLPPTAQHGLREAIRAAKNIEAAIYGRPLKPFVFTTLGQLATIGRRTVSRWSLGSSFRGLSPGGCGEAFI